MRISVIVTNWNGINLLKKYLEKVLTTSPEALEVILADDASTDDSLIFARSLQKKYPKFKIIAHKKNQGFGRNTNDAVRKSKGDYVVLLNSDIDPHKNYIKNSLHHFKDPKVIGVGFAELGHENYARLFWKNGYLQFEPGTSKKTHISAWISGGSAILRKDYFLKLGGFDHVYEPFYFEDFDFGLRAWRSGYTLLWEPKSVVEHKHESTISKFPKKHLIYVKERNHLISVLRNVTDKKLLFENFIFSHLRILSGPNYLKIILATRRQLKKYPAPICTQERSDRDLLKMFQK
ncbi:glycosyltransferase family 2 protein [Patescibacteria group bacterium]|nr:glycosyltransferase family 2 protein [Patescibacteria group bacterium]